MSHRLLLLRHAKSAWDDPRLDDHDRPLAFRGWRAAALIAPELAKQRIDLVACSPALRARQTLEAVVEADGLPANATVVYPPALYGATGSHLLFAVRRSAGTAATVLLIGHNPGMQDLALGLAGHGDAPLLRALESKFPTAALATLELPQGLEWGELSWGAATLVGFVTPRGLGERPA
jgi:phosphohistidine phosphatase